MSKYVEEAIKNLLKQTGADAIIEPMEQGGFFTAPCSSQYHLCCEGGLAEHSLNVYLKMVDLRAALDADVQWSDIVIVALLHDLGKMGQFNKVNYVPNMVDSRKKDADGNKIYKQSESKPYISNSALMYVDHEIRSIAIASQYIRLTEEQQFAILYHNGMYGALKYSLQGKETPLMLLLHFADMWCSRVTEIEEDV